MPEPRSWNEPAQAREHRERALPRDRGVVVGEQLEQPHEIRCPPLARLEPLAERHARRSREPAKERPVEHLELGLAATGRPVRPARAVGQDEVEATRADPAKDGIGCAQRDRGHTIRRAAAHCATEPCPGTYGGFRWTGTRFAHRRSACQRISALTWKVISGRRAEHVRERTPVQLDPPGREHCLEEPLAAALLVDPHGDELAGRGVELEPVAPLEPHERRHVERLVHRHPDPTRVVRGSVGQQQVGVTLPERVVHLGDEAAERAVVIVAPVERHGVEHVPEEAKLGEQLDAGAAHVEALRCAELLDAGAQPGSAAQMIRVRGARAGRAGCAGTARARRGRRSRRDRSGTSTPGR